MTGDYLMIHYGELSTKGANKKAFIRELARNIRHALKDEPGLEVSADRDHAYVALGEADPDPLIRRLGQIPGIQRISLVHKCAKDLAAIEENALALLKAEKGATFKVATKRADKTYPLDSYHLSAAVGSYVLEHSTLKVDIHEPDILLTIEIREEAAYLSAHSYPGAGGYPLGMNGKVLMMLSGGIDSPVASYLLLRRGLRLECLHFAAPPYTSEQVIVKLRDIIAKLNAYQADIKLTIVPFTDLQLAIYEHVAEPYCITVMRRMMLRIAERIAISHHCLAIGTGEAVGQVASQTLDSLVAINAVTSYPILRPLCATDKLESIRLAKEIGTYEISVRPYEDCCTIFKPKNPKTKPKKADCEFYEGKWDYAPMVDECVRKAKSILIADGVEKSFPADEKEKP